MNIGISGATGFVGKSITQHAIGSDKYKIRCFVRDKSKLPKINLDSRIIPDLEDYTPDRKDFEGLDSFIHLAARVHISGDSSTNTYNRYFKVNTLATEKIAHACVDAGVRRFVYLSSIKVNGELTLPGSPFTNEVTSSPTDPYGKSKYLAELALEKIAKESAMEVVIIRPPLVYGAGAQANFKSLMKLINSGLPLPLGSVHNLRSLVGVNNLTDFVFTCLHNDAAANQTFLVSDDHDVSTRHLVVMLSQSLGKKPKLVGLPRSIVQFVANVTGNRNVVGRLFDSLQVDISESKRILHWSPPCSMIEELDSAARHFLEFQAQ